VGGGGGGGGGVRGGIVGCPRNIHCMIYTALSIRVVTSNTCYC